MKKTMLTCTLISFVHFLFAQQDSVLNLFKYRIIHYRAISFSANAGNQNSQTTFPVYKNYNSDINGAGGVSYNYITSTNTNYLNCLASLQGGYSRGYANHNDVISRSHSAAASLFTEVTARQYTGNHFREVLLNSTGSLSAIKQTYSNAPDRYTYHLNNLFISSGIGIGKGRLENVTDMQTALWLNQSLKTANRLTRALSNAELIQLGHAITFANNTRVLDDRKRTQYKLETVDQFLVSNQLISKYDINYFSNLNDILFFAFNNPRFAGSEKFVRFMVSGYGNQLKQHESDGINATQERHNNTIITLTAGFNRYIPKNLTHQTNYGAAVVANLIKGDEVSKYFTNNVVTIYNLYQPDIKQAGIKAFYEYGFYPNSRTSLIIAANLQTGSQFFKDHNEWYTNSNVTANASYFISYHTRLTLNAGVYYYNNWIDVSNLDNVQYKNFYTGINAGIVVNI